MRTVGFCVCLLILSVVIAQQFRQPKTDWSNFYDNKGRLKRWMFKYIDRCELAADLEKYVGKNIRFVDEVSNVWEQFAEYNFPSIGFEKKACERERDDIAKKGYKGEFDNQEFKDAAGRNAPMEFLRFETSFFTCILDPNRRLTDAEKDRIFPRDREGNRPPAAEGIRTYAELLLALNAYKREGEKIPKEILPRLITPDIARDLLSLGGTGRADTLRSLREHPLLKQTYTELERRRHPKTVYIYGRVVRVVRFERVCVSDIKEGKREVTEEEYKDLVRRKYAEGAPGEEIVVIEVCHLEPVTYGDPQGIGQLERIEDEEVEFLGYRRMLLRLPPRPHRREGTTP